MPEYLLFLENLRMVSQEERGQLRGAFLRREHICHMHRFGNQRKRRVSWRKGGKQSEREREREIEKKRSTKEEGEEWSRREGVVGKEGKE